jgi:hypothetical protein
MAKAYSRARWAVKNHPSTRPTDASAIQSVTPSDMLSWPSPDVYLTQQLERTGREQNWFALTGRNAEPNEVLPLFSMEDLDKAKAFTASDDLR